MPGGSTVPGGAWSVWVVGLLIYFLAVFHRSSLAVAGLAAADRFDISASQLATFTMLQLLVYAGMQVPVGLLVDRYGSRSRPADRHRADDPGPDGLRARRQLPVGAAGPGVRRAWATR